MPLQEIHQIYNSFSPEGRDMSRHEFVKEMQRLTSPTKVQEDLGKIMMRKRMESRNRAGIDRAIENVG